MTFQKTGSFIGKWLGVVCNAKSRLNTSDECFGHCRAYDDVRPNVRPNTQPNVRSNARPKIRGKKRHNLPQSVIGHIRSTQSDAKRNLFRNAMEIAQNSALITKNGSNPAHTERPQVDLMHKGCYYKKAATIKRLRT